MYKFCRFLFDLLTKENIINVKSPKKITRNHSDPKVCSTIGYINQIASSSYFTLFCQIYLLKLFPALLIYARTNCMRDKFCLTNY